jgi:hypothetical protein
MKFENTKISKTTKFAPPSLVVVGSWIQYPGSGMDKNQDPGSGINIPDPQPCPWCILHIVQADQIWCNDPFNIMFIV